MVTTEKVLKFPHRRSIGTLYIAPQDQPEEWELLSEVRGLIVAPENQPIRWEWLEEARGNVKIPANKKVKLKISIRGASLASLDSLEADDLHALDLSHCQIIDSSLAHLSRLSGLKVLELTSTCVGDDGLRAISSLVSLQSLGLSHTPVTSLALAHLNSLENLREVWVSGTAIDDSGLKCFSKMSLLVQLGLSSTKVTDAGLSYLAHLHNLLRIYLFNTRVSHNGTQNLRRLIPRCRVKWHPSKIHTQDADETHLETSSNPYGALESQSAVIPATAAPLSEKTFWQIVDLFEWRQSGNDAAVIEPAVATLAKLAVEDICGFAEQLAEKLYMLDGEIYACQIGSDSYKGAKGDFSKNWFLYVRCCVVANGKDFYEEVVSNPQQMPKDLEFQAMLAIASKAYKRKTGQRFNYVTKYNYETFSNKQLWGRP